MLHHCTIASITVAVLAGPIVSQDKGPHDRFVRACNLISSKKLEQAEELLAEVVSELPKDAEVRYRYAQVLDLRKKGDAAKAAAAKAVALNPTHARALLLLAQKSDGKDYRKRVELAQRAAKHAKKEEWTVELDAAKLLLKAHASAAASRITAKLYKRFPKHAEVLYLLAESSLAARKLDRAATAYKALSKMRPFDPWPSESLGNVLIQLGKKSSAIKAFEKSLKVRPSNVSARRKLVGLLKATGADAETLRAQRVYLNYYERVAVAKARAKAKKQAKQTGGPNKIAKPKTAGPGRD